MLLSYVGQVSQGFFELLKHIPRIKSYFIWRMRRLSKYYLKWTICKVTALANKFLIEPKVEVAIALAGGCNRFE